MSVCMDWGISFYVLVSVCINDVSLMLRCGLFVFVMLSIFTC